VIRAHAQAVLEVLRADPVLDVYDSHVPNLPPLPYVVVWSSAPRLTGSRTCGDQPEADARWQTSSVGGSPEQARAVQERVRERLSGVRLAVAGRAMARVQHLASPPLYEDRDVDPPVFLAADQWAAFSGPAPT
jgi:hypothetical protein